MDSIRPRNLADYLRIARRRTPLIVITALVVTLASVVAIKRLPNLYESSTFIIVESPKGEGTGERTSLDLSRRLTTIHEQVTSRTRLEEIIDRYDLYAQMRSRGARIDDVTSKMRGDINVDVNSSGEKSTDAFTISYRADTPEVAQMVTAELANQLIADNVAAMQSYASGEADVLRQRATEISTQLRDLEEKDPWLLSLKEDAPLAPPSGGQRNTGPSLDAIRASRMTIEGLKDQQYKLQQQIADIEQRIAQQRQIVDQQKKSAPMRDNPTYAALIARRAELQGQRDNLVNRQELTDKHPRVVAVTDQIAAIDRQIAELKKQDAGAVSQTAEMRELAALESERNRLKTELEVTSRAIDRQVANPPVAARAPSTSSAPVQPRSAGSARLAQDYLGLKQTYKEVLSKLQDAELKRQTIGNNKVEQFRVLDQANLPQLPVWPNRRLMAIIALGAGLAIGIGFALLLEMRRFSSLQDAKDVEHYTRLPLLAAIPLTITHAEKKRAARRARMKVALGLAIAVVATFALTQILIITNVFALIGKR
ncbi:MAG: GNVR domain-containing protein [Acidobacteriota bacterium]